MQQYVPDLGEVFVRVTGERLGKFTEFEFSINDEYLTVELILPHDEFHDFCQRHRATVLGADSPPIDSRPGLYQSGAVETLNQITQAHRPPAG